MKDKIKAVLFHRDSVYILIIAILAGLFYFSYNKQPEVRYAPAPEPEIQYVTTVTRFELKDIGKLVTQEGDYTSVQEFGGSRVVMGVNVPFTEKKYIYSYDGKVTAGIDFEKIDQQIDEENQTVTVILPEAEIFDVVPDRSTFTILYEGDNAFNSLDLEEVYNSEVDMENELREKAMKYDILGRATENAKVLIRAFLNQSYDSKTWKIIIR